ncbi:TetR/AcrR family transcriptional regulator [Parafrigoribacterium humi]|jgi:AcrR family transcriptional regulator|uniref:TetR/AcrR family transcriptional regulator n=1 Tax=Parafrigoribacterium humi TaxID=3144664 RepID=UPI0032EFDD0E
MTVRENSHTRSPARERIVTSAYELFAKRGVRDVGVDELIHHSGVAISTFYRHFSSKDDLVLAFLARREQLWTLGLVESEARRRGQTPSGRLLAIFDVFDEWFQRDDYEACSFINVLLEMGSDHPIGRASIEYLSHIRDIIRRLGEEAGLRDLDDFVWSWHILMKGSIISAAEGDRTAALRARKMGALVIGQFSGDHADQPD